MEDIDVSAKSEKQFAGYWFVKDDITNKCIRTDGSLCIVWGVEYFGNIYDHNAVPCGMSFDKTKVALKIIYKISPY